MVFIIILTFHIFIIIAITTIIFVQKIEFDNTNTSNYIEFKNTTFFKNMSPISIMMFFLIIVFVFNSLLLAKLSIIKNYNKIDSIINMI